MLNDNSIKRETFEANDRDEFNKSLKLINNENIFSLKNWYIWKDVIINNILFKFGLVALMPSYQLISDTIPDSLDNSEKGTFNIASKLMYISNEKKPKQQLQLLKKIFSESTYKIHENLYIGNKSRRDELFIPLTYSSNQREGSVIYLLPWHSDSAQKATTTFLNEKQIHFKVFVSAQCLGGTSLRGIDQEDNQFPIIKHNKKFFQYQKIKAIILESEDNPFIEISRKYFEDTCYLISYLFYKIRDVSSEEKPKFYLHLPILDYFIYALQFYFSKIIEKTALLDNLLYFLSQEVQKNLAFMNKIVNENEILFIYGSPYDFLLSEEYLLLLYKGKLSALKCVKLLTGKDLDEINNENEFLENIKRELVTKSHVLSKVWADFLETKEINDIENLLSLGNAAFHGWAFYGQKTENILSILGASEKQIQVNYSSIIKELIKKGKNDYANNINFTLLENYIFYSTPNESKPIFYQSQCLNSSSKLIRENELIKKAEKNAFNFFNQNFNNITPLNQILENPASGISNSNLPMDKSFYGY